MESSRIFLDLPLDVHQVLAENDIDINDMLAREGLAVKATHEPLPVTDEEGSTSKELVLVILSATAGASAVLYALARVLDTIYRRPRVFEWDELEPLPSPAGGQTEWRITKKHQLMEPQAAESKQQTDLSITSEGVIFRMKTQ